ENGVTRSKKYSELSATEAIQADCDVKATNILLQGLLPEVYALMKEKQEKDKIGSKPNKNGKRGEARQCQKQSQSRKKNEENTSQRTKYANSYKVLLIGEKRRAEFGISLKYKYRGLSCQYMEAIQEKDFTCNNNIYP
nr:hypothetical protein [Tanacetum cinerariifolium]